MTIRAEKYAYVSEHLTHYAVHECAGGGNAVGDLYGEAVTEVYYRPGREPVWRWWIGNEEYGTAADYCPFCGVRLVDLTPEAERVVAEAKR